MDKMHLIGDFGEPFNFDSISFGAPFLITKSNEHLIYIYVNKKQELYVQFPKSKFKINPRKKNRKNSNVDLLYSIKEDNILIEWIDNFQDGFNNIITQNSSKLFGEELTKEDIEKLSINSFIPYKREYYSISCSLSSKIKIVDDEFNTKEYSDINDNDEILPVIHIKSFLLSDTSIKINYEIIQLLIISNIIEENIPCMIIYNKPCKNNNIKLIEYQEEEAEIKRNKEEEAEIKRNKEEAEAEIKRNKEEAEIKRNKEEAEAEIKRNKEEEAEIKRNKEEEAEIKRNKEEVEAEIKRNKEAEAEIKRNKEEYYPDIIEIDLDTSPTIEDLGISIDTENDNLFNNKTPNFKIESIYSTTEDYNNLKNEILSLKKDILFKYRNLKMLKVQLNKTDNIENLLIISSKK